MCRSHQAHAPGFEAAAGNRLMNQLHDVGVADIFFQALIERKDELVLALHDLQKAALVINKQTRDIDQCIVAGRCERNGLQCVG